MGLSTLYDAAVDLLGSIVSGFAAVDATLPARRFVSHGSPTQDWYDCEHGGHVAVWWSELGNSRQPTGTDPGGAGRRGMVQIGTRVVPFGIEIARCEPASAQIDDHQNVPSAAAITAAARETAVDAWVLWHVVTAREFQPFPSLVGRGPVAAPGLDPIVAWRPLGGLQGITTTLWCQIDHDLRETP